MQDYTPICKISKYAYAKPKEPNSTTNAQSINYEEAFPSNGLYSFIINSKKNDSTTSTQYSNLPPGFDLISTQGGHTQPATSNFLPDKYAQQILTKEVPSTQLYSLSCHSNSTNSFAPLINFAPLESIVVPPKINVASQLPSNKSNAPIIKIQSDANVGVDVKRNSFLLSEDLVQKIMDPYFSHTLQREISKASLSMVEQVIKMVDI